MPSPGPTGTLVTRLLGASIPGEIRWSLASIGANFAALATFATYFGPWLIGELHAAPGAAAAAYTVAGLAGIGGGLVGGRLTDRFGPRPLALTASAAQVLATAVLLLPGVSVATAAGVLIMVTFLQPVRGVSQRLALTAGAGVDEREQRFAAYRLVVNVGSLTGPAAGAAFVALGWWQLHAAVVVLYGISFLFALGLAGSLPGAAAGATIGFRWWLDPRVYLLLGATTAAWTVVYAYETL